MQPSPGGAPPETSRRATPLRPRVPLLMLLGAGLFSVGLLAVWLLQPGTSHAPLAADPATPQALARIPSTAPPPSSGVIPGAGGAGNAPAPRPGSSPRPTPPVPATARVEAPRVGFLAPDFTLNRLGGGQVRLSSFRGVRPVWINFWATWCPPCRIEMPEMQQIFAANKGRNLEILGVDLQEAQDSVQTYLAPKGFGWEFLLDSEGLAADRYHTSGIPTHVFIGKDGVIKDLIVDSIDAQTMQREVNKLLVP